MEIERKEQLFDEYLKICNRIRSLANEFHASHYVRANKVFMTNYHFYILKNSTELMLGLITEEGNKIFGMDIEMLTKTGDIIYVGYVEQG